MRYGSICSGIEAATVAWHPLGWEPAWFSEIDKFPSDVLKHHYPGVPNHGDFTKILRDEHHPARSVPLDVLVGGTPCQAFSVAGLRRGFDDDRGNLTLEFCRLVGLLRPRWVVWENVPGVLSVDGGRAFGSILGAFRELGYGFAYRVLDAQYFGVPQRRRRVFLVGHSGGDWRAPATVLFEPEGVFGNSAKSVQARNGASRGAAKGTRAGGTLRVTTPTLPIGLDEAFDGGDVRATQVVAHSVVAFHPLQDPICSVEVSHAMGTGTKQGTASVAVCYRESGPSWWSEGLSTGPLRAEGENRPSRPSHIVPCVIDRAAYNQGENAQFDPHIEETETMDPLVARGPHAVGVPCGFYATAGAHNTGFTEDGSPTLKCESSGWGSVAATIPFAFKSSYFTRGKDGAPSEIKPPLSADADKGDQDTLLHTPESIVRRLTPMECERLQGFPDDYTKIPKVVGTLTTRTGVANDNFSVEVGHCIAQDGVPRWITPTECERLQGFPDDYSKVPVKGKYAADGPRYKALGNSMAVPVMRWIGRRIAKVDALLKA